MKIDNITKILLAIIAAGIIGLNVNFFLQSIGDKSSSAKNEWKVISDNSHIFILKNEGKDICNAYTSTSGMITGKWVKTHC